MKVKRFKDILLESKKEKEKKEEKEKYTKKDMYKKGDYIAYKIWFPPSGMMADSKGEYSKTVHKGTIKSRSKHWSGSYEYTMSDGSTIKGNSGILGIVEK